MTPIKARAPRSAAAKKAPKALGQLPEWNLADLYSSMDAPEIKRDLDRGETECFEFEKAYKGRLADIAASSDAGRTLGEAVRRYEAIEDVLGRLISYAGLLYAGNSTDPLSPSSTATCRSASPRLRCIFCSSRSTSTASMTPRSTRRWRIRRSAITGPGSRIFARTSRFSSKTESSNCSTKSR
jgi:hypothetical protein